MRFVLLVLKHAFTHIVFKLILTVELFLGRLFDRKLDRTLQTLSCSFFLIVGILTFMSMKNTMSENLSRKGLFSAF